jgi:hypothetical protein
VDISQVLPLVLEHGCISSAKDLCSLILLSKSVKQTLTSCKVPCLEVNTYAHRGALATKVSGFALWFVQYGHLVRHLHVSGSGSKGTDDVYTETMLRLALAAVNGVRTSGLQEFSAKSRFCGPAMLSSLPAHSLKRLELTMTCKQTAAPSLPRVFQQLSNLRELDLTVDGEEHAEVVQLPVAFFLGLPQSLETLHMEAFIQVKYCLDIRHLTSLRALHVVRANVLLEGSSFPQSLHAATFIDTLVPANAFTLVSSLQLTLEVNSEHPPGAILQLFALKGLQELRLEYNGLQPAAAGAAAWGRVSQLRALQFDNERDGNEMDCQAILKGMAEATGLTSVDFRLGGSREWFELPFGVHIAQLQNLQELSLWYVMPRLQEMLHLKKLSQLTALQLVCSIDDATAAEVLGSLTGLKSLALQSEDIPPVMTEAIVPVIKLQLKGLRHLFLIVPGVCDASVGVLEGLTQLSKLEVGGLSGHSVDQLGQVLVGCEVTSACKKDY